jgi:hypothetical protein
VKDLGDGTYRCPSCKDVFTADEITPDAAHDNGLATYCKSCSKEYRRAWAKTETGRLSQGRAAQKNYRAGGAGDFFAKYYN